MLGLLVAVRVRALFLRLGHERREAGISEDQERHLTDMEYFVLRERALLREYPPPAWARIIEPAMAGEVNHVVLLCQQQDRELQRLPGLSAHDGRAFGQIVPR